MSAGARARKAQRYYAELCTQPFCEAGHNLTGPAATFFAQFFLARLLNLGLGLHANPEPRALKLKLKVPPRALQDGNFDSNDGEEKEEALACPELTKGEGERDEGSCGPEETVFSCPDAARPEAQCSERASGHAARKWVI